MARDRVSSPGTTAIPTSRTSTFDLSGERAVVVGNGNVAVDVARMLALTHEELAPTDTTHAAIDAIVGSGMQGDRDARPPRPGPGGVHEPGAEGARRARRRRRRSSTRPTSCSTRPARPRWPTTARPARRNVDLLREYAAREPEGKPTQADACASSSRRSRSSATARSRRSRSSATRWSPTSDGRLRAVATERARDDPVRLVLRSVGYRGVALPGVPFDESRGVIPNDDGRVLGEDGEPVAGVYCAGWIKRGPSGVIGTNKKDAAETVEPPARGRARPGLLPRGRRATSRSCSTSAACRSSSTRAGRRSTRHEREPRRAARPPAREARHLGRAARPRDPALVDRLPV